MLHILLLPLNAGIVSLFWYYIKGVSNVTATKPSKPRELPISNVWGLASIISKVKLR